LPTIQIPPATGPVSGGNSPTTPILNPLPGNEVGVNSGSPLNSDLQVTTNITSGTSSTNSNKGPTTASAGSGGAESNGVGEANNGTSGLNTGVIAGVVAACVVVVVAVGLFVVRRRMSSSGNVLLGGVGGGEDGGAGSKGAFTFGGTGLVAGAAAAKNKKEEMKGGNNIKEGDNINNGFSESLAASPTSSTTPYEREYMTSIDLGDRSTAGIINVNTAANTAKFTAGQRKSMFARPFGFASALQRSSTRTTTTTSTSATLDGGDMSRSSSVNVALPVPPLARTSEVGFGMAFKTRDSMSNGEYFTKLQSRFLFLPSAKTSQSRLVVAVYFHFCTFI
jgi:hypothetical protein